MTKRTALYDVHLANHAKMVDFFGWEMPLHYGSQLQEHHAVRQHAGIFDVSHMGIINLHGTDAEAFLSYLLANNIARISDGQALYSCLLNENAGILDDLIVYRLHHNAFRLIVNAGTTEKDLAWIKKHAESFQCTLHKPDHLSLIALQGAHALSILPALLPEEFAQNVSRLKPFHCVEHDEWMIARTGYTGEHGYEIMLPSTEAPAFFARLIEAGAAPAGLGARDTLRLEAGLNLYGADMDETVSPDESNLSWTISLDPESRDFIGKNALLTQRKAGVSKKLVGLVLQDKGILRAHQSIFLNHQRIGELTSGGFSPTLNLSIGFARLDYASANIDDFCFVDIRGKQCKALITKLPFVRHGKSCLSASTIS